MSNWIASRRRSSRSRLARSEWSNSARSTASACSCSATLTFQRPAASSRLTTRQPRRWRAISPPTPTSRASLSQGACCSNSPLARKAEKASRPSSACLRTTASYTPSSCVATRCASARVLLASTFDPTTAEGLGVRAIVERGEGDRVRLRYHAEDPAHLLDFAADAAYAKEWEFKDIDATGPPRIVIEKGQFVLTGDGAFRLPVLVASPFRAEWRLSCPDRGTFLLTFCDDAKGSSIRVMPHGEIGVADSAVQEWQAASPLMNLAEAEYTVALRHDGKSVTTTVDGVAAARTSKIGSRTRGGVALHVKTTQPCYLASLVIETTIDAPLRETLKQRLVAQRMLQIFGD